MTKSGVVQVVRLILTALNASVCIRTISEFCLCILVSSETFKTWLAFYHLISLSIHLFLAATFRLSSNIMESIIKNLSFVNFLELTNGFKL